MKSNKMRENPEFLCQPRKNSDTVTLLYHYNHS